MVVLDVADRAKPKLIAHENWSPPFGGGTHNCLPLPDRDLLVVLDEAVLDHQEDGVKQIWMFDNRAHDEPGQHLDVPQPAEADYKAKGGHFGPHNIHENRPGSFVSSELIFATYQNAGIRVFDIRTQFAPSEVGALVPAAPVRMMDNRPNRPRVIQSADVFVDAGGTDLLDRLQCGTVYFGIRRLEELAMGRPAFTAGFAIVSADGMLANAHGIMPQELMFEADQVYFEAALDRYDVMVHGRNSQEPHRNAPRAVA